jgi:hypothetical protein
MDILFEDAVSSRQFSSSEARKSSKYIEAVFSALII